MPSASTKPEKSASAENGDNMKQGIIVIEHKIRNLEKRKSKLEGYMAQQASGKELNSDQQLAVSKYDGVMTTLEFAKDLFKQFNGIVNESEKAKKKRARKEALEKEQQEIARVKDILTVLDVLKCYTVDGGVREDFLAGINGAAKLSEEDLIKVDRFVEEVTPNRDATEGGSFNDRLQKAAEHLVYLTDGKGKEVVTTTYTDIKQIITTISSSGYFDSKSTLESSAAVETDVVDPVAQEENEVDEEVLESVPTTTFQATLPQIPAVIPQPLTAEVVESTKITIPPQQVTVNEIISSVVVGDSSFHFLQDSELDSPDVVTPTAPPPSALPIPSQTFTNQNFVPQRAAFKPVAATQGFQPPPAQSVYASIPIAAQQQQFISAAPAQIQPGTFPQQPQVAQPPQHTQVPQPVPVPQQQPQPVPQTVERPTQEFQDANANNTVIENQDWNAQCEAAAASANNDWNEKPVPQQSPVENWSPKDSTSNLNDGFIPAAGNHHRGNSRGGRGGRGNYRGGPRGSGARNNSDGRGGNGGGGYYRNNGSSGDNGNYYQNGYQNRNNSDYKRGGPSRGGPRPDRGGPRGGHRGGNRGNSTRQ